MHILEVNSSRDHICSEEYAMLFLEEGLDDFLSFASFEFTVDAVNFLFSLKVEIHHFCIVINTCTGAQEHNDFGTAHPIL